MTNIRYQLANAFSRKINLALTALAILGISTSRPAEAFTFTTFPGSVFDANTEVMDANLGLGGYQIEDFEDTTLISGLAIDWSGGEPSVTSLDRLRNATNNIGCNDPFHTCVWPNNLWDGEHVLSNVPAAHTDVGTGTDVRFHIDGGATSFGIGISNMGHPQSLVTHGILVNGTELFQFDGSVPNFALGHFIRNTYLIIDAEEGETINSVEWVRNGLVEGRGELLIFDHVAVQYESVPEPGSVLGLLAFGALGSLTWRKRKQQRGS